MLATKTDVKDIAVEIRGLIKNVPHAVFSVKINRQWEKVQEEPRSVIYVQGGIGFATNEERTRAKMKIQGMMKDVAEEHQLELIQNPIMDSYILVQYH